MKSSFVLLVFGNTETGICTSKAETIGQCCANVTLLCCTRHVVAVKVFGRVARVIEVQGGWQDILTLVSSRFYIVSRSRSYVIYG